MVVEEGLVRRMTAEAIGTFILVLVGTSALMLTDNFVLAFGFALIVVVYAIGHISGAHVNPAVTLGLAISGRFPMSQVSYYWAGQVIGALVASLLLRLLYGNLENLGTTQVGEGFSTIDAFVIELVLTAILVFVVHAVATDERSPAATTGLAIGGTLLAIQIAAGSVSGGSVNPARSLAPAIVSGTLGDLWIYLIAPFIGAIIGAIAYDFIGGADATQIPAQVGNTTDTQRGRRGRGRGGRGGRGGHSDQWQRPEGQRSQGRPARAERERQKREDRLDRPREPWQHPDEDQDEHDDQGIERESEQRLDDRSGQRGRQRRVREPWEAREQRAPRADQDEFVAEEPSEFAQEDAPPPRRPQQRTEQRPERRPGGEQRTVQRPEQRSGQRRRRLPVEDTEEEV